MTPSPRVVAACVAPHRRKAIESALQGVALVEWHESLAALTAALGRANRIAVVILEARDSFGAVAGPTASAIAARCPAMCIVLYATQQEILAGAVGSAAITDVLIVGATDRKVFVRSVVLGGVKRAAADRVVVLLRARVNASLSTFTEAAVRYPSCATVESLCDYLALHRQTVAQWCRKDRFLRPEELLMWCRLLLVAAILEQTDVSVNTLANDLEFPSVASLRNQLKRYSGMTALEVRAAGLDALVQVFDRRIEGARGRGEVTEVAALG